MILPNHWLGLDDSHLVTLSDGHRLVSEAADAFNLMQHAAATDGVDIQIASSYRSFERQSAIWNAKWRGERAILDQLERPLDPATLSDEEKLHAILRWSALPGASRHHWGTDFDVYDKRAVEKSGQKLQLEQWEYAEGGPCHALANWITRHAATFGFTLPYHKDTGGVAIEPWHLSYAQEAESLIDIKALATQIKGSDIEGKSLILENLETLLNRYTFNRGME